MISQTQVDWGKMLILFIVASAAAFLLVVKATEAGEEMAFNTVQTTNMQADKVIFKTNYGDMEIKLFADKVPNTVKNFTTLVGQGFYNGTKFHRIIEGFMIQGGDPFSKNDSMVDKWGQGGPGYQFADEINEGNRNNLGTIAMANAGPNTNGSQFFINTADNNFLDTKHTVFGEVISGRDVLMVLSQVETIGPPSDRPVKPVILEEVILK